MTVSLPPEMVEEFEVVRKTERRTRSELVREALRSYFARIPVVHATAGELALVQRGEDEIRRGEFVTLDQLRNDLENSNRKKRSKGARKVSR